MASGQVRFRDIRVALSDFYQYGVLSCGYNDLRAVRSRDIRENAEFD